uniref:Transforming growth factor beta receptor associated protein 1 n=1 Tax=Rhinopithecus roxellana TaxID=61622 RepID=A0A2K6RFI5_RHIRO
MMNIKAFTLVSAVERELLMGDKERINIECVECCGRDLYVGTNDCFVYHFLLEERPVPAGPATFTATKQLHRHLGFKKPVNELRAASALNRLLVLCDNSISLVNMLNLEPVPSGARIKGAATFALNENPVSGDPFCVEVCIISVKRRTIQMFLVYEDRVQIVKEVSTSEQPLAVAVDGHFLCLALTTQYIIHNYSTGVSQDLFPYCSEERPPIVKRIGRQEFLLAGPGGLGMFATVAGISQRAPVHWSENVIGATVSFPYVIALDDEFITVHSMLDQQQKQTLPFKEGHILQDFEGRVIVATSKGVYILVPLPLEKQIQDLLASRRVEEALVLAKGARRNIPKEKFQVMYRRILQQAGFIQFAQLQFLEAKELFRYFALGLLYHYNNQDAAAVQLWVNIVNGDVQDSTRSDLYEYIVDFLTYCLDEELVWAYADWVLQKSEEVGVQVFTRRPLDEQQKNSFNPDDIINCLKKYPKALVKYLEHLVIDKRLQKEEYHTHLAVLYLEEVLQQRASTSGKGAEATETQAKLRRLLQKSDLYRVHFLLERLRGAGLPMESAILHGKLGEHEKALHILVHELRDFAAAEDYCLWCSEGREPPHRQHLFHTLLAIYLRAGPAAHELAVAAVDLLNHHATEFDAAQVLQMLPDTWSVQLLCPFLMGAMRDSVHARRTMQVALGLARSENLIYTYDKMKLKGSSVRLSDKKLCQICQNPFCEPVFVRYPNGGLVHTHCAASRHTNPSSSSPGTRT